MADPKKPLLVKRYASRRLYNTETSDYVTLQDIAGFIRGGREVQIVDLKSGDDLTRQYLLQIIAEHESRGESVLPVDVLTDLVRSYTTQVATVMPAFLKASFDVLRQGQAQMIEQMQKAAPKTGFPPTIPGVIPGAVPGAIPGALPGAFPGFEALRVQQEAFFKAMMSGFPSASGPARDDDQPKRP